MATRPTPRSQTKEYIDEYNKQYYQKNRDKLIEYSKVPITCNVCNKVYQKSNWSKHINSEKHIRNQKIHDLTNAATPAQTEVVAE